MDVNLNRFPHYMHKMTEVASARHACEAADRGLELAIIRERNAELASQSFESVAKGALSKRLGPVSDREREIGIAFARYATYGRTDE